MKNPSFESLETPALILDEAKMLRNIERMRSRLSRFKVSFRPHVKTCKCIEVARLLMESPAGPITVSTLHEADYFAARGVTDILYAVGIAPNKLEHVLALRRHGIRLSIILDSVDAAQQVADFAKAHGRAQDKPLEVMIEIDADGHRSGVVPAAPELMAIGSLLRDAGIGPAGVMTHAGKSYDCTSVAEIRAMAEQERLAVVTAAARLRAAGIPCPVVSVGSTPTAMFAENLDGVTEVRAGVYVFFDLVMAGLEVCAQDDIALSVVATVIGRQPQKGWSIVDAGWMAMSRDRGTARQAIDQGYGVVCDLEGQPIDDLIVIDANQEHGIIAPRSGETGRAPALPVGTQVRILPNHACATGAQHGHYHVVREHGAPVRWERLSGW
jgi:D-serine deaminase-like pyridoxal phosphate-dependent protein